MALNERTYHIVSEGGTVRAIGEDEAVLRLLYEKIVNRAIKHPEGLTTPELSSWLNGHARCQFEILDIIDGYIDNASKRS